MSRPVEESCPVGTKLYGIAPPGKRGRVYHVRGHIDGQVVLRWWTRARQRWVYEVTPLWVLRQWRDHDPRAGIGGDDG